MGRLGRIIGRRLASRRVPRWLKIVYGGLVVVLVPIYAIEHGWVNFLWFSNVALLLGCIAVLFESRWLASMMVVGVLVPELAWNLDFAAGLVTGTPPIGLTEYMFDERHALLVRGLSLYHVLLPVLLIWLVWRLGYERRAWRPQMLLAWGVLVLSYVLSDPVNNVNWAFGPGEQQDWMPPLAWLVLLMGVYPIAIVLPTHLLLRWVFRRRGRSRA